MVRLSGCLPSCTYVNETYSLVQLGTSRCEEKSHCNTTSQGSCPFTGNSKQFMRTGRLTTAAAGCVAVGLFFAIAIQAVQLANPVAICNKQRHIADSVTHAVSGYMCSPGACNTCLGLDLLLVMDSEEAERTWGSYSYCSVFYCGCYCCRTSVCAGVW
jgi:hypothetical protein